MARCALTTTDNPYNPFTQYDLWQSYDERVCGYYSNNYLARIAVIGTEDSGENIEKDIEDAVDEIVEMNLPLFNPLTGTRVYYKKIQAQ